MTRRVFVGLLIPLILACGGLGGPEPVKLEFTKWKVDWIGDTVVNEFDFLPGGTFIDQRHPSDVNTWSVDGNKIHMEYNSSFVIYEGEIVDEFTMGGTYTTQGGDAGAWRAVRIYD